MNDASLPPHAPMTSTTDSPATPAAEANGSLVGARHGEVGASLPQDTKRKHQKNEDLNQREEKEPVLEDEELKRQLEAVDEPEPYLDPNRPPLREVCRDIHSRVQNFLVAKPDSAPDVSEEVLKRTQERARVSLGVIKKALREYRFEELSLSYNGGKDCLVLLLLYLAGIWEEFGSEDNEKIGRNMETERGVEVGDMTHHSFPRRQPKRDSQQQGRNGDATRSDQNDSLRQIQEREPFPTTIPSIYAKPPDPFPLVSRFVTTSSHAYHLNLIHVSTNPGPRPTHHQISHVDPPLPSSPSHTTHHINPATGNDEEIPIVTFRDAFAKYLEENEKVKAIFVGTRRTDPNGGKLGFFDMTDGVWPRFMRVQPVIEWRLDEVWCFLRHQTLGQNGKLLDYCKMYDLGYTSLGGRGDTARNPKLRVEEGGGRVWYRPAFEMVLDGEERAGRE